jgi:hypothetical protein
LVARKKDEIPEKIIPGAPFYGTPHIHFFDKNFVNCLARTKADFIIWFSPYKHINFADSNIDQLPQAGVYEVSHLNHSETIEYNTELIFPSEA